MSNNEPKYPEVSVQLSGINGNAFSIMGAVTTALKRAKVPTTEIDRFNTEAMSGDYDNVIQTAMKWVNVY